MFVLTFLDRREPARAAQEGARQGKGSNKHPLIIPPFFAGFSRGATLVGRRRNQPRSSRPFRQGNLWQKAQVNSKSRVCLGVVRGFQSQS